MNSSTDSTRKRFCEPTIDHWVTWHQDDTQRGSKKCTMYVLDKYRNLGNDHKEILPKMIEESDKLLRKASVYRITEFESSVNGSKDDFENDFDEMCCEEMFRLRDAILEFESEEEVDDLQFNHDFFVARTSSETFTKLYQPQIDEFGYLTDWTSMKTKKQREFAQHYETVTNKEIKRKFSPANPASSTIRPLKDQDQAQSIWMINSVQDNVSQDKADVPYQNMCRPMNDNYTFY
ncbi:uncharacterized protein L201_002261 [Kwoniella dendrophila CBS 6074]|uniref:Uncharacterized protein n=1 Tax=Kwoniella dendrophila CBS 6074 TaxID=1295534 RepID=A0AAX4JRS5_9TREE